MMCYRDRTYCDLTECAKWNNCDRALTPKVYLAAYDWWGGTGAPIAIASFKECFEERVDKSE